MDKDQQKYLINGVEIWQPDKDLEWNYEKTYTEDSTRVISGVGHFTKLFTTQSFAYKATHVPVAEWTKISQMVITEELFDLYTWSPHFGRWMTHRCYVGKGSLVIGSLENGYESYSSISFNMVDNFPLEMQK